MHCEYHLGRLSGKVPGLRTKNQPTVSKEGSNLSGITINPFWGAVSSQQAGPVLVKQDRQEERQEHRQQMIQQGTSVRSGAARVQ